jgi:hypothetical protein
MASRPTTSRAGRPATSGAAYDPSLDTLSDRDPQYTYSQEFSAEDEGEESDDGNVFAFLPPSPAGPIQPSPVSLLSDSPWQSHAAPSQHPLAHKFFPAHSPSPASPPPFYPTVDPLVHSPPTFIPPASTRYNPQAGASTTSVHFVGTVDSPCPSTGDTQDVHSFSIENGFRLRNFGGLPTALSTTTDFSTTTSSQPPFDDIKPGDLPVHEKQRTSTALSDLSTFDPELDGAESVSIKCVYSLFPFLPADSPEG